MLTSIVTGATGRLGREVVARLVARGDHIAEMGATANYVIFAHRYRGPPVPRDEVYFNAEWVGEQLERQHWAPGDRAAVLVSSVNAYWPEMQQSLSYNASKAALNNVCRYLAHSVHMQALKVRINSISPSTFTTKDAPMNSGHVADVIEFLASPKSFALNGQDIIVSRMPVRIYA